MDTSALITMVVGMLIIWGGLVASVTHAVRVSRRRDEHEEQR
jgi:hypothetical protein